MHFLYLLIFKNKELKSLSLYLFSELSSKLVPFLTIILIAKLIQPEAFGELTLYFIVYELLIIFIGNNIAAVSRIDFFKLNRLDLIFGKKAHLIGSFTIAIAILVVALLFSYYFEFNLLFFVILVLASIFRTISFFVLADMQCKQDSLAYAKLNAVYIISLNISFLVFIFFWRDVQSWFYSLFIGAFIQMLVSFYFLKKDPLLNQVIPLTVKGNHVLKEVRKGLVFVPQAIGFWIKFSIDRVLLSSLSSRFVLGNYMFAFQLSFPIVILSSAINLFMTPKINLYLKNGEQEKILKKLHSFLLLILLACICIYLLSKVIITNYYFDSYSKSLEYTLLICLSLYFYSCALIYINIFYYVGKKIFVSYFVFSTSVLNLLFGYLGLKIFGTQGLLIANILINLLSFIYIFYKIEFIIFKKNNGF